MVLHEDIPEWFELAFEDLGAAKVLLQDGFKRGALLHIQQAIEKALKGWLLARNWKLQKTHDLLILAKAAKERGRDLQFIMDDMDLLSTCYFLDRYPAVAIIDFEQSELSEILERIQALMFELRKETLETNGATHN